MRILHLIHDFKFINLIDKYYAADILNECIFLNKTINYGGIYKDKINQIIPFSKEYFQLIKKMSFEYDIIIIYNLDYDKSYLINRIPKGSKSKIIWNFFGTEIYNNPSYPFVQNLYDLRTRMLLKPVESVKIKNILRFFKYLLKGRLIPAVEIRRSIRKIDYFTWYSKEEYDYLSEKVNLPPFLRYPLERVIPTLELRNRFDDKILLGNSRAPENNHLDILTLLQELKFTGKVLIPFSYGSDAYYVKQLQRNISSLKIDVRLLSDFLPYNEYVSEITTCTTAIYNSFRQMAVGNIFISLASGAKVYLSEKNLSYAWLKNLDFLVFSIENNLINDLRTNRISLSEDEKKKNKKLYITLTDKKNIEDFVNIVRNLIFKEDKSNF